MADVGDTAREALFQLNACRIPFEPDEYISVHQMHIDGGE
jgi:hypothetical protein